MSVNGNAGDEVNDLITVNGQDDDGNEVSDSDDATVTITNVPSTITVTKTANPTVVQDSGPVTFTVVVRNNSAVDTVYIQTLTDSIYGNLNGKGTCTLEDGIAAGPAGLTPDPARAPRTRAPSRPRCRRPRRTSSPLPVSTTTSSP